MLVVSSSLVAVGTARAHDCRYVEGSFSSSVVPPPYCESPVGLCTAGMLEGDIDASYEFNAQTLESPGLPYISVFTGQSLIVTEDGGIYSNDAGDIDFSTGDFYNVITISGGDGDWEEARGELVAVGILDFATGVVSGTYAGMLCGEREDHHGRRHRGHGGHGGRHGRHHD